MQASKHHYYSCHVLEKDTSFYQSNENSDYYQHSHSQASSYRLQNQKSNTIDIEIKRKDPFVKRILIVDDDPDTTLTFKVGLDEYHYYRDDDKRRFEVYAYNNPIVAVREFKPNFYDILLTDINLPHMNGFELSEKVLELDINLRVCFMSAAEVNIEALREIYPKARSIGCFIKKPVTIEFLAKKLEAELY
jgi:CheY-like chemotaxis protein